jgi:hypothetical protein
MQQFNSTIMTSRIVIFAFAWAVWGCGENSVPKPVPVAPTAPAATTAGQSGAMGTAGKDAASGAKSPDSSSRRDSDLDGGTGGALRLDGDDCRDDAECASGHCNNDLCCSGGQCCLVVRDCDATDGIALICDYASTCQGSRGKVMCENFRCAAEDGTPNDTGCDRNVEADDCGPYQSVTCNGARDQDPPRCPETCAEDNECDGDAYCDNAVCVRDVPRPAAPPDAPAGPIPCMLNSDCDEGVRCLNGICEGSDRPPPAPRDGGVASESCLDSVGDDACGQCACENCETTATACWDSGDAERDGLCSAVLECALAGGSCINSADCEASSMSMPGGNPGGGGGDAAYGCFGRTCYCGTGADCYTAPNGDCVEQIQAAAGNSTSATTISTRRADPTFAIYDAEEHARCLQRSCRTECGL